MAKKHEGKFYEFVKQPPKQPPPLCCDGCEVPKGHCHHFRECTRPEGLGYVWKLKTEENGS